MRGKITDHPKPTLLSVNDKKKKKVKKVDCSKPSFDAVN
jgi:hypothetical protein